MHSLQEFLGLYWWGTEAVRRCAQEIVARDNADEHAITLVDETSL